MSKTNAPNKLEQYLTVDLPQIIEKQNIPGASIVIVRENEILQKQTYGFRDLEQKKPVTPKTLFAIGSTSKAVTATVLGTLVDEGKLGWDDLVIDHIPEFRTIDPVATLQMTVRDIQCHRSGLPRHDLVWLLSDYNRQQLLEKIKYLEPFAPFRSTFHYNNFMWMVAGIIGERITGKSWEENVQERIFNPLGIKDANFTVKDMQNSPDFSFPYEMKQGLIERVPFRKIDAIGPAGSINANIDEYAKWLMLNTNHGRHMGKQVISPESMTEIHAPQMSMPITDEIAQAFCSIKEFSSLVYTLGWVSAHFRGRQHILHAGGIDGFSSFITLLPEEKLGFALLTNRGGISFHYGILFEAVDRYFGDPDTPWVEMISSLEQMELDAEKQAEEEMLDSQVKDTSPSHPLESYSGEYSHPAYGTILIKHENGSLTGTYHDYPIRLTHYHFDTFRLSLDDGSRAHKFLASFVTDSNGKVKKVLLPLESKVAEIEFMRRQSPKYCNGKKNGNKYPNIGSTD